MTAQALSIAQQRAAEWMRLMEEQRGRLSPDSPGRPAALLSHAAAMIATARARYVSGDATIDDFERALDENLPAVVEIERRAVSP